MIRFNTVLKLISRPYLYYIKDQNAVVEGGKIKEYRVTGKVSFELDHGE